MKKTLLRNIKFLRENLFKLPSVEMPSKITILLQGKRMFNLVNTLNSIIAAQAPQTLFGKTVRLGAVANALIEEFIVVDQDQEVVDKYKLDYERSDLLGRLLYTRLLAMEEVTWKTVPPVDGSTEWKLAFVGETIIGFQIDPNRDPPHNFLHWYRNGGTESSSLTDYMWSADHLMLQYNVAPDRTVVPCLTPLAKSKDPLSGKKSIRHFHKICEMLNREPVGSMLVGKPGTGKTQTVANATAALDKRLLSVSVPDVQNNIQGLIQLCEVLRPDVLFLDDVDHTFTSQNIFQLIDSLRRMTSCHLVMAANKPTVLDEAVWRPGRIEHLYQFDLPDLEDRAAILKDYGKMYEVDVPPSFVSKSKGFSGAFLKEMVRRLKFEQEDEILEQITILQGQGNRSGDEEEGDDEGGEVMAVGENEGRAVLSKIPKNFVSAYELQLTESKGRAKRAVNGKIGKV